jgi:hypothetical protein
VSWPIRDRPTHGRPCSGGLHFGRRVRNIGAMKTRMAVALAGALCLLAACDDSRADRRSLARDFPPARLHSLSARAADELRACLAGDPTDADWPQGLNDSVERGVATRIRGPKGDRGCLAVWRGVAQPEETLAYTIGQACVDPRYPPVAAAELPELSIEVSVFGKFRRVSGPFDFKLGVDTLMLANEDGPTLIQAGVATDLKLDKRRFVESVCRKAGLRRDAWKDRRIRWYAAHTLRAIVKMAGDSHP